MKIFDRVNPGSLEQRELHLWVLALTTMAVMSAGLALMIYPAVFAHPVAVNGPLAKQEFFGFCVLSVLLIGYLVDRQIVIRLLRKRLEFQGGRLKALRHEASTDMLAALPDLTCFRDCLAMECLRASVAQQFFSIVTVQVVPDAAGEGEFDAPMAYSEALRAISRKLRGDNSIYSIDSGVFGIVLPDVGPLATLSITRRLTEALLDASGASNGFSFIVNHTTFPDDVTTAREMEEKILSFPQPVSVTGAKNQLEPVVALK